MNMQKIQILVICRHEEILQTIVRLINKNENWEAIGAGADEKAIELFHQHSFDLVLLGSGISDEEENKIRKIFAYQNPQIKIIQHFGGGSGLLSNEIEAALSDQANGNFNVSHV
jgi:DNA-binding NarL/FixJ family response regulator